jgi:cytosine deaminase
MNRPDYVLRDVTLADGSVVDIEISGAHVGGVAPAGANRQRDPGLSELDGRGLLALPPFVNLHTHLDKAYTRDLTRRHDGTLIEAIRAVNEVKTRFDVEDVAERAERLIRSGVREGATYVRTHVDVDTIAGLRGLEGVRLAAERNRDLCEVVIVAFPMLGLTSDVRLLDLMRAAVENGAGLVGGIPHIEPTVEAQRAHVNTLFDLAERFDLDVDMHVDESDDGSVRTLEMVAEATIERGWHGRVTAGHVCALSAADEVYAARVIARCAEAEMTIISNPPTNLVIQGRGDRGLVRRGLTRVSELRAAGINVCFGQDNVCDGFYPFGRGSMLEVALLAAHAAHLTSPDLIDYALAGVSSAPARAAGIVHGIRPGGRADFSLFRAPSWVEALRLQQPPELVFFGGRPVACTRIDSVVGAAESARALNSV